MKSSRNTRFSHHGRRLSVITILDDDVNNDNNNNDNDDNSPNQIDTANIPDETQYSTPNAPSQINPTSMTTTTTTTMPTLETLDLLTSHLQPSFISPSRQYSTTVNDQNDIETINLITSYQSPIGLSQPYYVPRTLHKYNLERLTILPAYVTMNDHLDMSNLLLANVSSRSLSSQQLACRQVNMYPCSFKIRPHSTSAISMMVKQYDKYFRSIATRLHVDLSILDYNYIRLEHFLYLFGEVRKRILPRDKCLPNQLILNDNEYPLLLEFYLQIDVDLFYMKTCSFNQTHPRSMTESLFCSNQAPHCHLCQSMKDHKDINQQQIPVVFNQYEKHTFVNGYESILNCPATCQTKNFIYVLTCLCGEVDYISETKYTLSSRLQGHRTLANQLIRRFLIGEKNLQYHEMNEGLQSLSNNTKTQMSLYQHSIQCSTAIQRFLDANPSYWCFVPMLLNHADQDDTNYWMTTTTTTTNALPYHHHQNNIIKTYLNNITKPPPSYRFSRRQIDKQIEFFTRKLIHEPINDRVDLFQAKIIAVLPPNSSDLFRQIIHSLFVTHTEAKLNILGHVFNYKLPANVRQQQVWCAGLQQRRLTSTTMASSNNI